MNIIYKQKVTLEGKLKDYLTECSISHGKILTSLYEQMNNKSAWNVDMALNHVNRFIREMIITPVLTTCLMNQVRLTIKTPKANRRDPLSVAQMFSFQIGGLNSGTFTLADANTLVLNGISGCIRLPEEIPAFETKGKLIYLNLYVNETDCKLTINSTDSVNNSKYP